MPIEEGDHRHEPSKQREGSAVKPGLGGGAGVDSGAGARVVSGSAGAGGGRDAGPAEVAAPGAVGRGVSQWAWAATAVDDHGGHGGVAPAADSRRPHAAGEPGAALVCAPAAGGGSNDSRAVPARSKALEVRKRETAAGARQMSEGVGAGVAV